MSPEEAAGLNERVDARTDVYGLGAILYEILTGRPPVQAKNMLEVLVLVRQGKVTPPRQLSAWLPKPLEAICLKAAQP